jgi:hypothetical protein
MRVREDAIALASYEIFRKQSRDNRQKLRSRELLNGLCHFGKLAPCAIGRSKQSLAKYCQCRPDARCESAVDLARFASDLTCE